MVSILSPGPLDGWDSVCEFRLACCLGGSDPVYRIAMQISVGLWPEKINSGLKAIK